MVQELPGLVRLVFIQQFTTPRLYTVNGQYVQDVKLVKTSTQNLLLSVADSQSGLTIVDRNAADAAYYYRFDDNYTPGVDFDSTNPSQLYFYVAHNLGNPGGVARLPWRQNNQAVNNETLTYLGIVDGLHTYQSAHAKWMREPAPSVSASGLIDYTLGRVQFGAAQGTVTASYSFWIRTGVDSPGAAVPVEMWWSDSAPALTTDRAGDVVWHAPSAAFYARNSNNPGTVTRIKAGAATHYNATNHPGLQSTQFNRIAKAGDELYIATEAGVSRVNEVSGQVTVANPATTGNLTYAARDIVVDGPIVFTADANYGEVMLYRGTVADGANRLGRGICDTSPLVSNEVSACNGNASYSDTDLALPGKGLPFAFLRSYNAQDNRAGPLGAGWTHALDAAITLNPFSTVAIVRNGDGRRDKYQKQADGSYVGQVGVYDSLVRNGDNTWRLTQKDQTKLNFDASGRLTSIVDRNNNAITPGYDGSGRMTSILDSAGRTIMLAFDGSNRFAGQEEHSDLGLVHMRARWYDPASGRFISRDPVVGSPGSPQTLNQYPYVRDESAVSCLMWATAASSP